MIRKALFTLFTLIGIVLLASCNPNQTDSGAESNIPNPASMYCEQNGGKLELRQDASGGVAGVCVLPDGSECDEWAYFRGECQPGDSLEASETTSTPETNMPNPASDPTPAAEFASDGWKIYRNEQFGYSFHYPADVNIFANDDPLRGLSLVGDLTENEYWPMIFFSHPSDRQDYRPPEDVDLAQWLTDHYLLGSERAPDVQIAGTTAVHTRQERSQQSFAYDNYYFAKSGQLYTVVILHTGDKEDWELYNRFLESIQF